MLRTNVFISFCSSWLCILYILASSISITIYLFLFLSLHIAFSVLSKSFLCHFLFFFSICSFFSWMIISEIRNDQFNDLMACLPLLLTIGKIYKSFTMCHRRKLKLSSTRFKIFEMLDSIAANRKIYIMVRWVCNNFLTKTILFHRIFSWLCQGQHFCFYFQEILNGLKQFWGS